MINPRPPAEHISVLKLKSQISSLFFVFFSKFARPFFLLTAVMLLCDHCDYSCNRLICFETIGNVEFLISSQDTLSLLDFTSWHLSHSYLKHGTLRVAVQIRVRNLLLRRESVRERIVQHFGTQFVVLYNPIRRLKNRIQIQN